MLTHVSHHYLERRRRIDGKDKVSEMMYWQLNNINLNYIIINHNQS